MARKSSPKRKAPAKVSVRAKADAAAAPAKAKTARPKRAPPPLHIVVIDDEIGADPATRPVHAYNRDNFTRDVGRESVIWSFNDAFNGFAERFLAASALAFVRGVSKPDLFLVDLMFGAERTLGFDIIDGVRAAFPNTPVALLTTHCRIDMVTVDEKQVSVGAWLDARGVGLINKEAIFSPGVFWRDIAALLKTGGSGKGGARARNA